MKIDIYYMGYIIVNIDSPDAGIIVFSELQSAAPTRLFKHETSSAVWN